ncbi:DUF4268 domain-containing protein [Mesorhizobium sp. M0998]|uniref:DUF4268 domain-containing protein n=1 Tax=Mesorhizobium sp. M0998 TaxID=2957044 RepID=UPI00333B351F
MDYQVIGRLERVALREVWKHEAYDFTQWLQQNIDVLNDAMDLNLVSLERERAAGSFSIDLVGEDEFGATIIIENQLEKSNHDHLGKVITYLTAMAAKTAVWIVSEPRPEHVAAITWLNEASSANFYLVKVEAVRIGASPAAPLLTVIVGPSEETKDIGRTKKEIAERHNIRHDWWSRLLALPEAKLHAHLTPNQSTWIAASSGVRGLSLNYVVTQDNAGAELFIYRGKGSEAANKAIFDQLAARKSEIETSFGGPLNWERLDGKHGSRIRANIVGGYRSPDEDWQSIQKAQADAMNRLNTALQPYIKKLNVGT